MKRIIQLIVVLFSSFLMAQEGPKITFDTETIDYGTVDSESNGERVFTFRNTGDAPLIIKNVQSTCGCTIPTKPEAPIAPGKKGEIKVKYDMRKGPISKTITVESNAVNVSNGIIPLRIRGMVE